MKRIIFIVPIILLLASCGQQFRNVQVFKTDHPDCRGFVIIQEDLFTSTGYIDRDHGLRIFSSYFSMSEVRDFIFSPNGEFVLVESWGEGAQSVGIFQISSLIKDSHCKQSVRSEGEVSGFPFGLCDLRWQDDKHILFTSGSNFNEVDRDIRRSDSDFDSPVKRWQWDFADDTFEEVEASVK